MNRVVVSLENINRAKNSKWKWININFQDPNPNQIRGMKERVREVNKKGKKI